MTYPRLSSLKHAYYFCSLLLLMVAAMVCSPSALAQPAVPPPVTTTRAIDTTADTNPKTSFDTREDYFDRFPFAKSAFDHDDKTVYPWDTQNVEGPPTSFWDSLFSSPGQAIGGAVDGLLSNLGFGPMFGGSNNSSSGSGDPVLRSQYSEPLNGAASPEHVTAYPFFIKFCNDNPYQGVCYWQMGEAMDSPRTERDKELFENVLTTFGYPVSDTQFQIIQRENFQRMLELMYDPERYVWMATNTAQMQAASAANSLAGVSENAFGTMVQYVMEGANGDDGLRNVANEASASAPMVGSLYRSIANVYGVVIEMYKHVYVPMAILFLLPGAVVTQVKATVSKGFSLGDGNPFEGIIRSMVAVFLIPGTQVIVSYSIDVGNSMATTAEDWVDVNLIMEWQHELTYNVNPQDDHINVIIPPDADHSNLQQQAQAGGGGVSGFLSSVSAGGGFLGMLAWLAGQFIDSVFGSGGEGLGANVPEADSTQEQQLALSQAMQFMFNGASYLGALMLIILTAMQVVLICYLFLLGPLTAAFFAWPEVGGSNKLFRNVFGNWVLAVIMVSLWRFYWVLGLVIMTQRLEYIGNPMGTGDLQWEVAVFVCILGLMIWSSMSPFSFDPAKAADYVESFAKQSQSMGEQMSQGKAGPQGGGGGEGGDGGQGTSESNQSNNNTTTNTTSDNSGDSSSSDGNRPQLDGADNASAVPVADSQSGGDSGSGGGGDSGSSDGGQASSSSMDSRSPEGVEAPPTDSGSASGAGGADGGGAGDSPPLSGSGGSDMSASMDGQIDSSVLAAASAGNPDADIKAMSSDGAPLDMSPTEGDKTSGYVNPNANESDVSGGGQGTQGGAAIDSASASAQSGGSTDGSGGGAGGGDAGNVNLSVEGAPDDGGSDSGTGGQSEAPPPPSIDVPPPPSADDE